MSHNDEQRNTASAPTPTMSLPETEFISCEELLQFVEHANRPYIGKPKPGIGSKVPSRNLNVTIFDVRPSEDFGNSRIKIKQCLNIHPEEVRPSMSGYHLEELIRHRTQGTDREMEYHLFIHRSVCFIDAVVLVDWGTTSSTFTEENPLNVLRLILQKKDVGEKPPRHLILDGGYAKWLALYPGFTTNPDVVPPANWQPKVIPETLEIPDYLVERSLDVPQIPVYEPTQFQIQKPSSKERPYALMSKIEDQYRELKKSEEKRIKMAKNIIAKELKGKHSEQSVQVAFQLLEQKIQTMKKEIDMNESELNDMNLAIHRLVSNARIDKYRKVIKKMKADLKKLDQAEAEIKKQLHEFSQNESVSREEPLIFQDVIEESELSHITLSQRDSPQYSEFSTIQEEEEKEEEENGNAIQMEIDNELIIDWRKPKGLKKQAAPSEIPPGTTGVINSGNTCYVNTVVQCLAHLDQLTEYFLAEDSHMEGSVCREFKTCLKFIWSGKYKQIFAHALKSAVAISKQFFSSTSQQDCHEFLTALLELMHDELKEKIEDDTTDQARSPEYAMNNALGGTSSIISDTFYGQICSRTRCNACRYQSNVQASKYDVFMSLNLPLPDDKQSTLEDCVHKYFEDAEIDDWYCNRCEEKQKATRMLDLIRAPPVLIIQLVRYKQTANGNAAKNSANVEYPMEILIKTGNTIGPEVHMYYLRGISRHLGVILSKGHYIAVCKNSLDNKWYEFNDTIVSTMTEKRVLDWQSEVYLLFYSIKL